MSPGGDRREDVGRPVTYSAWPWYRLHEDPTTASVAPDSPLSGPWLVSTYRKPYPPEAIAGRRQPLLAHGGGQR